MKELKKAQMGMIAILTVMLVSIKRRLPTRRLSSGITTLALAGIVLLVAVGSASANPACGATITTDITLDGNMSCPTGNGLIIGADGITIDGAGYKITGDVANITACTGGESTPCVTHSGVVNDAGWANVVVKNLEIENFCTGVVIGTGTTAVENMTVTKCLIHGCGESNSITHGIHLVASNNCTICQNEIYNQDGSADMGDCGTGGNGICMYGGSASGNYGNYNTITCNYLHDNAKCGLHAKKCCMHNTISYNNASSNHGAGIMPECKKSDWNTIEYNTMLGNGYHGFYTCGNHNSIRYNTIKDNGYGSPWGANGIKIGAGVKPPAYGQYNDVLNNSVSGTNGTDVWITQDQYGLTNNVDDMTCDSGNNATYCDDWSSSNPASVYFDYDSDEYYSKDTADCACGIIGSGKCACCNPGLFNTTHAGLLNDTAHPTNGLKLCWLTAGDDINDCDPSITSAVDWYCDGDGDTYISSTVSGSGAPGDKPAECSFDPGNDCNDTNAAVNPGATEDCTNGIDDDCDGLTDCDDPYCKPDLNITAKTEERINDTHYNVNYTVCNIGICEAGISNTSIYIDETLRVEDPVGILTENQCYTHTVGPFLWTSPSDNVTVCADSGGQVDEKDEGNNCKENVYELVSDVVVAIDPCPVTIGADPSDRTTVDITLSNIVDYGTGTIHLYFDTTYVDIVSIGKGDSTSLDSNKQTDGHYKISASNTAGIDGDVVFANVTFKPMGPTSGCSYLNLVVETLYDRNSTSLGTVVNNCSNFCIEESNIPGVTTPTASPTRILNDNGRARVSGTNLSTLSVWVTDDTEVKTVTINLTPIRGAGYEAVSMTLVSGTKQAGTWSVETNATRDDGQYLTGINMTHCLAVNATDVYGNSHTANCVTLEVLRRGDIDPVNVSIPQNNKVDIGDYNEIARYTVGLRSMPDEFTAGTVPADSHNGVDMADALYIAMYATFNPYPGYQAP